MLLPDVGWGGYADQLAVLTGLRGAVPVLPPDLDWGDDADQLAALTPSTPSA